MLLAQTSYTLNTEQLEAALGALGRASEAFRLSPLEERLYRALGICARIGIASSIVTVTFTILALNGVAVVDDLLIGLPAVVFLATGGVATLLLFANSRLILTATRQRRLISQLGLRELSYSAWNARRKGDILGRIGSAGSTVVGVGLLLVAVLAWFAFGSIDTLVVATFVFGATILTWRALQRSREHLQLVTDASHLRATLTALRTDGDARVIVPAAVLTKVAGLEQAGISRERARAVLEGVNSVKRGYGVQITRQVSEQKAALPSDHRLEVEELIDRLVSEPHRADALRPAGSGVLRAYTESRSMEVDYDVDEAGARIHILALRALPSGSEPSEVDGAH